ncbi:MAG: hypothetical protein K6T29_02585 [Peptococcaceae bacterium]|nr:hypothetical protein [Peptococcaceae bacterium]
MDWLKYRLMLLFFCAAVAAGVAVILAEFNVMIRPAGPVRAFGLEEAGPGVYRVEFLGEKATVQVPAGAAAALSESKVRNGEYFRGVFEGLEQKGGQALREALAALAAGAERAAKSVEPLLCEIKKRLCSPDSSRPAGGKPAGN